MISLFFYATGKIKIIISFLFKALAAHSRRTATSYVRKKCIQEVIGEKYLTAAESGLNEDAQHFSYLHIFLMTLKCFHNLIVRPTNCQ